MLLTRAAVTGLLMSGWMNDEGFLWPWLRSDAQALVSALLLSVSALLLGVSALLLGKRAICHGRDKRACSSTGGGRRAHLWLPPHCCCCLWTCLPL